MHGGRRAGQVRGGRQARSRWPPSHGRGRAVRRAGRRVALLWLLYLCFFFSLVPFLVPSL